MEGTSFALDVRLTNSSENPTTAHQITKKTHQYIVLVLTDALMHAFALS